MFRNLAIKKEEDTRKFDAEEHGKKVLQTVFEKIQPFWKLAVKLQSLPERLERGGPYTDCCSRGEWGLKVYK